MAPNEIYVTQTLNFYEAPSVCVKDICHTDDDEQEGVDGEQCNTICMNDSSKFSQIFCVKFAVFTHAVIITTKMPVGRFSHCDNIAEVKKL